ncbi:MAG: hypothetical protein Q9216_004373 [Gyalolechia sp. 2 TL-2023]
MTRHLAPSRRRFFSMRRMFDDVRYLGRGLLRLVTNNPRTRQGGDQAGDREDNHDDDAVLSTPQTNMPVANASQDDDEYDSAPPQRADFQCQDARSHRGDVRDEEVEHLRSLEFYRRVRILADETHSWNSALTPNQREARPFLLGHYRITEFVPDLAEGHHDGYTAALRNQEYDNYYSDLRSYVELNSAGAATALQGRADPHLPPGIALTIPPIYEPSDLPPYTASVLPPGYSAQVPPGHVARDIPLCTAGDCPVRKLGIDHSCGLYHHDGQVGPVSHPQNTWLPSFGQSNPPPEVWHAYNYMVLGIAKPRHFAKVHGFVRCHGQPWRPQCEHHPSAVTQATDRSNDIKIIPPSCQSQGQMGRIPCPQPLIPVFEIENQGLEPNKDLGQRSITETLMAFLERERPGPAMQPRLGNGDVQHHSSNRRRHHRSAVFPQSDTTRSGPTAFTATSTVVPPLPISLRRQDATLSEQTSHLSEVPDAVSGSHSADSVSTASPEPTQRPPFEAGFSNNPYRFDFLHNRDSDFSHQHTANTASNDHGRQQAGAYAIPPFPARPERQSTYHSSRRPRAPPSSPSEGVPRCPTLPRIPSDEVRFLSTNNTHIDQGSPLPRLSIRATDREDLDGAHADAYTATTPGGFSDEDRAYYQRLVNFADRNDSPSHPRHPVARTRSQAFA